MLVQASLRPLPGHPRGGFLLAIDARGVASSEPRVLRLLHQRTGDGESGAGCWWEAWSTTMTRFTWQVEAIVDAPTRLADRIRLQDSDRVLCEWTVDW